MHHSLSFVSFVHALGCFVGVLLQLLIILSPTLYNHKLHIISFLAIILSWRNNKRPKSTKFERLLASALDSFAKDIDYKTNPEVRLSSCTWYTPDFIIGNRLIVEVDGGIHDLEYRKTPDRIRQRALENMGYSVCRVRNKEVESSPFDVAGKRLIVNQFLV